jgi:hypothetical protein
MSAQSRRGAGFGLECAVALRSGLKRSATRSLFSTAGLGETLLEQYRDHDDDALGHSLH